MYVASEDELERDSAMQRLSLIIAAAVTLGPVSVLAGALLSARH